MLFEDFEFLGLCKHRIDDYDDEQRLCYCFCRNVTAACTHNTIVTLCLAKFIMCSPLRFCVCSAFSFTIFSERNTERDSKTKIDEGTRNKMKRQHLEMAQPSRTCTQYHNGMWEYTQMVGAIHRKIRDIVRTRTNFNTYRTHSSLKTVSRIFELLVGFVSLCMACFSYFYFLVLFPLISFLVFYCW